MAICPFCFSKEKSFWAWKCSECNSWVPLPLQIVSSLIYNLTIIGGFIFVMFYALPWIFRLLAGSG